MRKGDHLQRLVSARSELALSPRAMAAQLLTSLQTYGKWEGGQERIPDVAVVAAEALVILRGNHRILSRSDRNEKIRVAIEAGEMYAAVARRFGVSRQRVRYIAGRLGILEEVTARRRAEREAEQIERRRERKARAAAIADARAMALKRGKRLVEKGLSIRQAVAQIGRPRSFETVLGQHIAALGIEPRQRTRWTGRGRAARFLTARPVSPSRQRS